MAKRGGARAKVRAPTGAVAITHPITAMCFGRVLPVQTPHCGLALVAPQRLNLKVGGSATGCGGPSRSVSRGSPKSDGGMVHAQAGGGRHSDVVPGAGSLGLQPLRDGAEAALFSAFTSRLSSICTAKAITTCSPFRLPFPTMAPSAVRFCRSISRSFSPTLKRP